MMTSWMGGGVGARFFLFNSLQSSATFPFCSAGPPLVIARIFLFRDLRPSPFAVRAPRL